MQVKFNPSVQQQDVFDWITNGEGSCIVEAVAGAGKTTTLVEAASLMQGRVFLGVYNKTMQAEIQRKITKKYGNYQTRIQVSTIHSAGLSTWGRRMTTNSTVDSNKVRNIITGVVPNKSFHSIIAKLVSFAKQEVIGVDKDYDDWQVLFDKHNLRDENPGAIRSEDIIFFAKQVLNKSIEQDYQVIDYDDMLFAPLVHDAAFSQYDWVLIDEAQDTNRARRLVAQKLLKPGGRFIAVGDSRQAIYGFAGASADSLDKLRDMFNCTKLPLTITYRCPKSIVRFAHSWVDHIQAHDTAPEGRVRAIDKEDILCQQLTQDDVVICRYVKPLTQLSQKLIQNGIACHIEGRDIGKSLSVLVRRFKVNDLQTLIVNVEEHLARETEKLLVHDEQGKIDILEDKVETIVVISRTLIQQGKTKVSDLLKFFDGVFSDTGEGQTSRGVTLATVHKSKGREWNRVFLLGREKFMPSARATQDWQRQQEFNLIYVAVTRAKQELVEVVYR
jgi:DNA helicase-2/ATP-dependent DNA helicase PcrA